MTPSSFPNKGVTCLQFILQNMAFNHKWAYFESFSQSQSFSSSYGLSKLRNFVTPHRNHNFMFFFLSFYTLLLEHRLLLKCNNSHLACLINYKNTIKPQEKNYFYNQQRTKCRRNEYFSHQPVRALFPWRQIWGLLKTESESVFYWAVVIEYVVC